MMVVELGQVWKYHADDETHLVTKIEGKPGKIHTIRLTDPDGTAVSKNEHEKKFGDIDHTGHPDSQWAGDWDCIRQETKVEVGQIWTSKSGKSNTITAIKDDAAYDDDGDEFGCLRFGYTDLSWNDWELTGMVITRQKQAVSKETVSEVDKDFEFFKAPTQAGHCVCRIPKELCDYHR